MDAGGRATQEAKAEGRGEGKKQWFTPSPKPSPPWGEGFCDTLYYERW